MSADPSLPKLIVLLLLYWLRVVSLPFAPARLLLFAVFAATLLKICTNNHPAAGVAAKCYCNVLCV